MHSRGKLAGANNLNNQGNISNLNESARQFESVASQHQHKKEEMLSFFENVKKGGQGRARIAAANIEEKMQLLREGDDPVI